jgi:hypothetical protein
MSKAKMDHIWTKKYLDRVICSLVSKALRKAHRNSSAARKHIARTTQLNELTIRKWYEGKNPPSAAHLLILMRHYPDLLHAILQMMDDIKSDALNARAGADQKIKNTDSETGSKHKIWGDILVTPTGHKKSLRLNQRQLWFMEQVGAQHRCTSKHIEQHWRVARRTAKRDIAALVAVGAIRFVRSGQSGYYAVETDS